MVPLLYRVLKGTNISRRFISTANLAVFIFRPSSYLCARIFPRCAMVLNRCSVQWVRTRANESKESEHAEEGKAHPDLGGGNEGSPSDEQQPEKPKVDPNLLRKLRIYVLVVAGLSFVMSFIALSQMATGQAEVAGLQTEHLTRQGIDMQSFLTKYLRAGEVRRIIFCPDYSRAVAFLHTGAVIDDKIVHDPVVVVSYPHSAQQFWADIRKEEEDMGISISDGVKLDMYKGMTALRMIEMAIGVLIIVWLGTQYGRLLRKRILANRQMKSGGSEGGGEAK